MSKIKLYPPDAVVPRLRPVDPRRRGRGGVESLSSYIARLAVEHNCSPYVLLHRGLVPESRQPEWRWTKVRGGEGHLINAYGDVAQELLRHMREAVGIDVSDLTALGLRRFCDPRGKHFMHTVRPWCADCYSEARAAGLPAWDPLYVFARSTTVCVWHETPLRFWCDACKKRQRPVPRIPFLDICEYCGADLAAQAPEQDFSSKATRDHALWSARAFMDILDTAARGEDLSHENFMRNVTSIRDTHFSGMTRRMSVRLRLSKSSAKNWIERQSRPTWLSLLDLAWRLDLSVVQLVGPSLSLTDPAYWRLDDPISLDKKHARRSSTERDGMRETLRAIVDRTDECSAGDTGLREIARRLGTSPEYLSRNFPDEARLIKARRAESMRELAQIRDEERHARISAARQSLVARGLNSTTRNLRQTGSMSVTDLIEAGKRAGPTT